MKVLVCNGQEEIIKDIPLSGVSAELGCDRYTQRVVISKAGYRICVWYAERKKGFKTTLRLAGGEKLTVRGPYIVFHEEYGAYGDIALNDIGEFKILALEEGKCPKE